MLLLGNKPDEKKKLSKVKEMVAAVVESPLASALDTAFGHNLHLGSTRSLLRRRSTSSISRRKSNDTRMTLITPEGLASVPSLPVEACNVEAARSVLCHSSPVLCHWFGHDCPDADDSEPVVLAIARLHELTLLAYVRCASHAAGVDAPLSASKLVRDGQTAMALIHLFRSSAILRCVRAAVLSAPVQVLTLLATQGHLCSLPQYALHLIDRDGAPILQ